MRHKIRDAEEARWKTGGVRGKKVRGREGEEGGTQTDAPHPRRHGADTSRDDVVAGNSDRAVGEERGVKNEEKMEETEAGVGEEEVTKKRVAEEKRLRERERGWKCRQDQSLEEFALDRPLSVLYHSKP